MALNSFLVVYLCAFICFFLWELILNYLQLRALKSDTPYTKEVLENFNSETLIQSQDYSASKTRLGLFSHCYSNLILLCIIFSGSLVFIHKLLSYWIPDSYYFFGLVYILTISFVFQLIELPLQLYSTFVVEEKYGFNKSTLTQWTQDLIKGLLLSFILMSPLILGILWFVRTFPEYWWLLAYFFIISFQALLLFIYPVWIAPFFNKFERFPDGELREAIFKLSGKLRFDLNEVYLMDGSKRSSHGNAYFTGFGKNQRVVLFDTLVENLSVEQIIAVLAHEIGHKKLKHVAKQLFLMTVVLFVILAIIGVLFNYLPFYQAFGFSSVSPEVALVLFSFLISPFLYFFTPVSSILQRKYEYQADRFAKEAVGNAESLSQALIKIYQKNLGNLKPHTWYSFFHYSHPTLSERLAKLRAA